MLIVDTINNWFVKILDNWLPESILVKLRHQGFLRYFKNTGWMFFGRLFTLVFSFFVGVYIARYLGPEKYGILNYVMSFVLIFSFIPAFGIDSILMKELVKHPEKKDQLLGTGFTVKVVGGLLAIVVVLAASFIVKNGLIINLLVFFYSFTFVFQAFNVLDTWFSSQVLSKKSVLSQMLATLGSSTLKLIFIFLHFSVYWILLAFVSEGVVLAIGLVLFYKKAKLSFSTWNFDKNYCASLLKISWPLMLSTLFGVIFLRIDQVMLKFYLGAVSVGIYSAAAKLSEVMYFVPGLIVASLLPAIVNARTIHINLFESRLKKLYLMMFLISFFISVVMYILSDYLVVRIFGHAYASSSAILKIYIWSLIPIFLGNVVNQYLIVENYTKIALFLSIASAVINVVLNLLLIPKYGMIGAAWATFYAALSMIIFPILFKRTRRQLYLMGQSLLFR